MPMKTYQPKMVLYQWASMDMIQSQLLVETVMAKNTRERYSNMEELLVDLHHEHKRRADYSALEVSRKRAALENVLIPETVAAHKERLAAAGFSSSAVWLRYFNFVSIIAIR